MKNDIYIVSRFWNFDIKNRHFNFCVGEIAGGHQTLTLSIAMLMKSYEQFITWSITFGQYKIFLVELLQQK